MEQVIAIGKQIDKVLAETQKVRITNVKNDIEAVQCLSKITPEVIILNTVNVTYDPESVIKRIRKIPKRPNIPLILLVEEEQDQQFERFYEDGITIGIKKDVCIDVLLFYIKQMIAKSHDSKKKILVVDDDQVARTVLATYLKPTYKVAEVSTGTEALRYLERHNVDLIFLDIVMPEMDGRTLFKRIQEMDRFKKTPVLFQTGHADINTVKECIKLGPAGYLVKPFEQEELLGRIEYALEHGINKVYEKKRLPRVMYIDRNESNFGQIKAMLEEEFEVLPVNGGIRAVNMLETEQIQTVLINMDNSGFCYPKIQERINRINQKRYEKEEDLQFIKIVMATSDIAKYSMDSEQGYSDSVVLKMPFSKAVLVETLKYDL